MAKEFSFPVFRKYAGNRSYFRIDSLENYTELKIWGRSYRVISFTAKLYPDRLFIADMLEMKAGSWVASNAGEFEAAIDECRKNLNESFI
jgi:hypothetical protein